MRGEEERGGGENRTRTEGDLEKLETGQGDQRNGRVRMLPDSQTFCLDRQSGWLTGQLRDGVDVYWLQHLSQE